MIFTIPHFLFGFFCSFSGQTIFDDWYISFYNLLFSCFPLVSRALFEQDVYYKTYIFDEIYELKAIKKNYPFLYSLGTKSLFSETRFMEFILKGILHGLIIFFLNYSIFIELPILNSNGDSDDLWLFSLCLFTCVVFIANLQIALLIKNWYVLTFIAFLIPTFGAYISYMWISEYIISFQVAFTISVLFNSHIFYYSVFLVTSVIFMIEYYYSLKSREKETLVKYFLEIKQEEKQKLVEKIKLDPEKSSQRRINKSIYMTKSQIPNFNEYLNFEMNEK